MSQTPGSKGHDGETITVVVRVRPMNSNESLAKETSAVAVDDRSNEVIVGEGKAEGRWTFDKVFGQETDQEFFFNVYVCV